MCEGFVKSQISNRQNIPQELLILNGMKQPHRPRFFIIAFTLEEMSKFHEGLTSGKWFGALNWYTKFYDNQEVSYE